MLEGTLVEIDGITVGKGRAGKVAGETQVTEGLRRQPGPFVVPAELLWRDGLTRRNRLFQLCGNELVQPAAILAEKGIVGRLLDQGVTKFEIGSGAVMTALDEAARFKLAEGVWELLAQPGQPANLRCRELATKDGGEAKQAAELVVKQPLQDLAGPMRAGPSKFYRLSFNL